MNTWFNGFYIIFIFIIHENSLRSRINIQIKELCFDKSVQNLFKSSQFDLKLVNLDSSGTSGNCNVNHLQTKLEKANHNCSFAISFF